MSNCREQIFVDVLKPGRYSMKGDMSIVTGMIEIQKVLSISRAMRLFCVKVTG
jgi:hypothetical protein